VEPFAIRSQPVSPATIDPARRVLMSREEKERAWKRARSEQEVERKLRERRERHELRLTTRGSAQWARVMARQVMEVAIRRGMDPDAAAQRAAEVEAGLIEGQKRTGAQPLDR
jgi:hypothetical protein